jgi:hypothetical protein
MTVVPTNGHIVRGPSARSVNRWTGTSDSTPLWAVQRATGVEGFRVRAQRVRGSSAAAAPGSGPCLAVGVRHGKTVRDHLDLEPVGILEEHRVVIGPAGVRVPVAVEHPDATLA